MLFNRDLNRRVHYRLHSIFRAVLVAMGEYFLYSWLVRAFGLGMVSSVGLGVILLALWLTGLRYIPVIQAAAGINYFTGFTGVNYPAGFHYQFWWETLSDLVRMEKFAIPTGVIDYPTPTNQPKGGYDIYLDATVEFIPSLKYLDIYLALDPSILRLSVVNMFIDIVNDVISRFTAEQILSDKIRFRQEIRNRFTTRGVDSGTIRFDKDYGLVVKNASPGAVDFDDDLEADRRNIAREGLQREAERIQWEHHCEMLETGKKVYGSNIDPRDIADRLMAERGKANITRYAGLQGAVQLNIGGSQPQPQDKKGEKNG